jgi:hypothetical protein
MFIKKVKMHLLLALINTKNEPDDNIMHRHSFHAPEQQTRKNNSLYYSGTLS